MFRPIPLLAASLCLAACHGDDRADNEAMASGFVPPKTQAATPVAGQASTVPLSAYVGKYPHDAVDGVMFYDRTDVATALDEAIRNAAIRPYFRERSGPETPIFNRGGRIGTWACEAHDCGAHNWALLVDPKTGEAEACYHDAVTMGATSRWYMQGLATTRQGDCPPS